MSTSALDPYRRRAEEFAGALDREYYLHFSGQKPEFDTAAIYEAYADLFTREAVDAIEAAYRETSGDERRRVAYLAVFATDGYLGQQTRELSDRLANVEAQATIEVDGERIGLRQAVVAQSNEPDRERRQRIQDARLAAVDAHLNPLADEYWRRLHRLAVDLGYPHYKALYSTIRGLDYDGLRAEAEAFLLASEGLYERLLDRVARERLGLGLEDLRFADLPYLWRAPEFDPAFPAGRLLPTLRATLAGLGIDLDAQANVHLDTEVRELKSPRAFCAPVRVPDEIYLVVLPQGGYDDYGALLHEAGHTEHFAHVSPERPFEYRCLGDNAVTEAFAFVFDHLLVNRDWLRQVVGFSDCDAFVRFAVINDLYFLRRYAAKVAYEATFHAATGSLDAMADEYRRRLTEALFVEVPPESYLIDIDPGFYAVNYMRAWMLEGSLRVMLEEGYSKEWFRNPAAAEWLRELWGFGQELSAEQLLLRYGGGRLDFSALRHLIEREVGR